MFLFFYFVSVVASFKLGAHLVHHPEAPMEWMQWASKRLQK